MYQHPVIHSVRRLLTEPPPLPEFDNEDLRMLVGQDALRILAEAAIEDLIALLDELDGDENLEPSTSTGADLGPSGLHDECEPDEGDYEPDSDGEPSLGAAENHVGLYWAPDWGGPHRGDSGSQHAWASGNLDEREGDEHDGREPDDDTGIADHDALAMKNEDESSLGWTTGINQASRNWQGLPPSSGRLSRAVIDGEDGDDTGIADERSINVDDEPGDNGVADDGGVEEVMAALAVRSSFEMDRSVRGLPPFKRYPPRTVTM